MCSEQLVLLKDVAKVFTGPPTPSGRVRTVLRSAGPIEAPLLTVGAIGSGAIIPDQVKTTYADATASLADYRVMAGDILLAARSTFVRCAIIPAELGGAVASASVLVIRCDASRLLPRLLVAFFEHRAGQTALFGASQSTTVQHSLTVRTLRELQIPLPAVEVQHRLVGLLEAADAQRAAAEASIQIRYKTALHIAVTKMIQDASGVGDSSQ